MPGPDKPAVLAPITENIPAALRELPQWLCWRYLIVRGGPYDPRKQPS